jgi:hypothetical protein
MASAIASSRVVVEDRARLRLDLRHPSADPRRDVGHAHPEDARHADHHPVAGFEQIGEAGLHARAAGRRERQRHGVSGAEQLAQALLHVVEHGEEGRVEVSDQGLRHGVQDPGVDVGGTRAEQEPARQRRGTHIPILTGLPAKTLVN